MNRVQRHAIGSVRFDKRRKTWNFLWYDGKTRRSKLIGSKQQYPTKAAAWKAVERLTGDRKAQSGPCTDGQNARDPLPGRENAKTD